MVLEGKSTKRNSKNNNSNIKIVNTDQIPCDTKFTQIADKESKMIVDDWLDGFFNLNSDSSNNPEDESNNKLVKKSVPDVVTELVNNFHSNEFNAFKLQDMTNQNALYFSLEYCF
jgi:hypothetical protein